MKNNQRGMIMSQPILFKKAKEIADILGIEQPDFFDYYRTPYMSILFKTMAEKIKHLENEVEVLKQSK